MVQGTYRLRDTETGRVIGVLVKNSDGTYTLFIDIRAFRLVGISENNYGVSYFWRVELVGTNNNNRSNRRYRRGRKTRYEESGPDFEGPEGPTDMEGPSDEEIGL